MAITNVGIVYQVSDKTVLRVIVPDTDAQLNSSTFHSSPSEALYKMAVTAYNLQTSQAQLLATLAPILALL